MSMKHLITFRKVVYWKNKKMCYRVPLKIIRKADRAVFYCPHIPKGITGSDISYANK